MTATEGSTAKQIAMGLLDFIGNSPTPWHVVSNMSAKLEESGFVRLDRSREWRLAKGGKYYVTVNGSGLMAFETGEGDVEKEGFRILGAHTDSPGFRVKPKPEMLADGKYVKLNTAPYGGAIYSTWFDRPLSIAGRFITKSNNIFKPNVILMNIEKPLLMIPSLAIHFNRGINEGGSGLNPQKDLLPFLGFVNGELENRLLGYIAGETGISQKEILDFELCLYETQRPCLVGENQEFISGGRLDDLWSVYDGLWAFLNVGPTPHTKILYCPDNEEIGSMTPQGAFSRFQRDMISQMAHGLGANIHRALANSFGLSADLAHAAHPNYADLSDPTSRPLLGAGPVLKYSPTQKYATTAKSAAVFRSLCQKAGVPCQSFINRSDMPGGSTIGAMTASELSIPVIDMGAPVWAMHSIREFAALEDDYYTREVFKAFFQ